jgi:hypothetical protein
MSNLKRIALAVLAAAAVIHGPVLAQGDWQTYSDATGRFTVTAPGALKANPPITDENGVVTYTFAVGHAGKAYVVAYADGNLAEWRKEMDAARDALLKGLAAVAVSEHNFKSSQPVGDVEATEFTCRSETQGTECQCRTLAYKSRLYMIGVVYKAGTGAALGTAKFLDSFRITS